jgi:hypothetical protein
MLFEGAPVEAGGQVDNRAYEPRSNSLVVEVPLLSLSLLVVVRAITVRVLKVGRATLEPI